MKSVFVDHINEGGLTLLNRLVLENSGKEILVDNKIKKVPITQFINKELVLFSIEDCERSIPNLIDGFKPSQRKVMHGILKKNTKEECLCLMSFVGVCNRRRQWDRKLRVGANASRKLPNPGWHREKVVARSSKAAHPCFVVGMNRI